MDYVIELLKDKEARLEHSLGLATVPGNVAVYEKELDQVRQAIADLEAAEMVRQMRREAE